MDYRPMRKWFVNDRRFHKYRKIARWRAENCSDR